MNSIGETLRSERLRRGLDLQQVSQSTKIGTRMLQAMEADDLSKLPGGVFTRSFIKQYATALGMDPATLEPELKALHVEGDEVRRADFRPDRASSSFPSLSDRGPEPNSVMASVVWVVLALLVCGGVYYFMNRNTGTQSGSQQAASRAPASAAPANAGSAPESDSAKKSEQPSQQTKGEQQTAVAEAPSSPAVAASGPVQVTLNAKEPVWVAIVADGKSTFKGTLHVNEKREFSASETLKLTAGNAGGLEISLNGKPIDPIGPRGQIRVVELTPAGVQVVSRTPPNRAPLL